MRINAGALLLFALLALNVAADEVQTREGLSEQLDEECPNGVCATRLTSLSSCSCARLASCAAPPCAPKPCPCAPKPDPAVIQINITTPAPAPAPAASIAVPPPAPAASTTLPSTAVPTPCGCNGTATCDCQFSVTNDTVAKITAEAVQVALGEVAKQDLEAKVAEEREDRVHTAADVASEKLEHLNKKQRRLLARHARMMRQKQKELSKQHFHDAKRVANVKLALMEAQRQLELLKQQHTKLKEQDDKYVEEQAEQKKIQEEEKAEALEQAREEALAAAAEKKDKQTHVKSMKQQQQADMKSEEMRDKAEKERTKKRLQAAKRRNVMMMRRRKLALKKLKQRQAILMRKAVAAAAAAAATKSLEKKTGAEADRLAQAAADAKMAAEEAEHLKKVKQAFEQYKAAQLERTKRLEDTLLRRHSEEDKQKDAQHKEQLLGIQKEMKLRQEKAKQLALHVNAMKLKLQKEMAAVAQAKQELQKYIAVRRQTTATRLTQLKANAGKLRDQIPELKNKVRKLIHRRKKLVVKGQSSRWDEDQRVEYFRLADRITRARRRVEEAQNKALSYQTRMANLHSYDEIVSHIISVTQGRELARKYKQVAEQERIYMRRRATKLRLKYRKELGQERRRSHALFKFANGSRKSPIRLRLQRLQTDAAQLFNQAQVYRKEYERENNMKPVKSKLAVILTYQQSYYSTMKKWVKVVKRIRQTTRKMGGPKARFFFKPIRVPRLPKLKWTRISSVLKKSIKQMQS